MKGSGLKCENCPISRFGVTCLDSEPACPPADNLKRRTIKIIPKEDDHD